SNSKSSSLDDRFIWLQLAIARAARACRSHPWSLFLLQAHSHLPWSRRKPPPAPALTRRSSASPNPNPPKRKRKRQRLNLLNREKPSLPKPPRHLLAKQKARRRHPRNRLLRQC